MLCVLWYYKLQVFVTITCGTVCEAQNSKAHTQIRWGLCTIGNSHLGATRTTPPQGGFGGVAVGAHSNDTHSLLLLLLALILLRLCSSPWLSCRSTLGIPTRRLPHDLHLRSSRWCRHCPAVSTLLVLDIVWIICGGGPLDHVTIDAWNSRPEQRWPREDVWSAQHHAICELQARTKENILILIKHGK